MGKTLRKYLIREIGGAFLAGLAILTFILLIARILEMVDLILARGVPAGKIAALFAYVLPSFLELTAPAALLFAIVVAFGRLTSDGEITAIRAAGIPTSKLFIPTLGIAAIVAVATFGLAAQVRPWANRQIRETVIDIARTRATSALQPGIFNSDFDGFVIYVKDVDRERGLLARVLMADERDPDGRTVVFANSGRVKTDDNEPTLFLQLLDGTSIQEEHDAETYEVTDFESFEVRLQSDAAVTRLSGDTERPQDLSWSQLRRVRRELRERGEPVVEATIEVHARMALAAASLFLAAIAVPLGLQHSRSVRARGFVVCGVVVLGYYLVLSVSTTLARQGYLPPAMGPWIPNLALAVLAMALAPHSARGRRVAP